MLQRLFHKRVCVCVFLLVGGWVHVGKRGIEREGAWREREREIELQCMFANVVFTLSVSYCLVLWDIQFKQRIISLSLLSSYKTSLLLHL